MINYEEFNKSLLLTIREKQVAFDRRNRRFEELVEKFHGYQKVNPEQAEAYLARAKHHEGKLEVQIAEILRLQEVANKLIKKAG